MTLGMGMTEKQGGTDVRSNQSRATRDGDAYRISGHKWFMSAPMCDAFLVLAQADEGLTCFFMPRFTPDGSVNAVQFQRLKDKLGNRSNASSEVEFAGAYAERVGDEGMDQGEGGLVGNVCAIATVGWGNVEEAFERAHLVVEGEYRYPKLYGYAMEPYNALAFFDQGDLIVFSSAQHVYMVRRDLARMFHLPLARVRVSAPYVGGGYGTKSYTKVEGMTAAAAHFTGRPVKLDLSVEEAILTTRSASARIRARSAFTADGKLLARDFEIVMNSGAYTDNTPLRVSVATTLRRSSRSLWRTIRPRSSRRSTSLVTEGGASASSVPSWPRVCGFLISRRSTLT